MAYIIVLIDGVGLAHASPSNLVAAGMPQLSKVLLQPLDNTLHIEHPTLYAAPIDATLAVPGLPQSGSGHATIWGGFNAAAFNGRHQPSYPTIAMRERLKEHNLFRAAQMLGQRVAWANAYLPGYSEAIEQRRLRHTAGTWAALQTGLPLYGIDEAKVGVALTWDITQHMARYRPGAAMLPTITPASAAARLRSLTRMYDLIAFETYLPDLAAHNRLDLSLAEALTIVDGFAANLLVNRSSADTVIITSDHGNSEDSSTTKHTRNPVPLIVAGAAAAHFRHVQSIDQIVPTLLEVITADSKRDE